MVLIELVPLSLYDTGGKIWERWPLYVAVAVVHVNLTLVCSFCQDLTSQPTGGEYKV